MLLISRAFRGIKLLALHYQKHGSVSTGQAAPPYENIQKFQNSPRLQHWASVKNLKTAAASYAAADNLSKLQKQIDDKTAEAKSARTELVELEHQMKKGLRTAPICGTVQRQ